MTLSRRGLLLLPAGLAGCSVLPSRPYQEVNRFALAPERPQRAAPGPRRPVLLIRTLRVAPGLDQRGLRSLQPDGQVRSDYWSEWAAPPVDLAEDALRRWLTASGRLSAVIAPGSRLRPDFVLEGELTRLETVPAEGIARAGLSLLLLTQGDGEQSRVLAPILADGSAPLAAGAGPAEQATAMRAALGAALANAERGIAAAMAQRVS